MKNYWKASMVVALIATAALISASTSGAQTSHSTGSGCCSMKGHYSLTVLADQNWVQPAEKTLAAKFKKLTGITVNYNIVPDSSYQNLLTTKLNSNENPGDIFMIQPPGGDNSGLNTTFRVQSHAVDLSQQPWVSKEFKITRSLLTYKSKLYGQTIWDTISGSWVIVYNKIDFAKAGIKNLPTTFKQFHADCAKLKAKHVTPFSSRRTLEFLAPGAVVQREPDEGGGRSIVAVHEAQRNKTKFAANTYTKKAMTEVNSLYQSGYFGSQL